MKYSFVAATILFLSQVPSSHVSAIAQYRIPQLNGRWDPANPEASNWIRPVELAYNDLGTLNWVYSPSSQAGYWYITWRQSIEQASIRWYLDGRSPYLFPVTYYTSTIDPSYYDSHKTTILVNHTPSASCSSGIAVTRNDWYYTGGGLYEELADTDILLFPDCTFHNGGDHHASNSSHSYSFEDIILHEFGHAIGLCHTNENSKWDVYYPMCITDYSAPPSTGSLMNTAILDGSPMISSAEGRALSRQFYNPYGYYTAVYNEHGDYPLEGKNRVCFLSWSKASGGAYSYWGSDPEGCTNAQNSSYMDQEIFSITSPTVGGSKNTATPDFAVATVTDANTVEVRALYYPSKSSPPVIQATTNVSNEALGIRYFPLTHRAVGFDLNEQDWAQVAVLAYKYVVEEASALPNLQIFGSNQNVKYMNTSSNWVNAQCTWCPYYTGDSVSVAYAKNAGRFVVALFSPEYDALGSSNMWVFVSDNSTGTSFSSPPIDLRPSASNLSGLSVDTISGVDVECKPYYAVGSIKYDECVVAYTRNEALKRVATVVFTLRNNGQIYPQNQSDGHISTSTSYYYQSLTTPTVAFSEADNAWWLFNTYPQLSNSRAYASRRTSFNGSVPSWNSEGGSLLISKLGMNMDYVPYTGTFATVFLSGLNAQQE